MRRRIAIWAWKCLVRPRVVLVFTSNAQVDLATDETLIYRKDLEVEWVQ